MSSEQNIHAGDKQQELTAEERVRLFAAPILTEFQRHKLDRDSKKNWDLFYKRNGDRFFKSRYWTRNEFGELYENPGNDFPRYLLEVGCGCGDFILPFLEENHTSPDDTGCDRRLKPDGLFIYCCDISDQAISILKGKAAFQRNNPARIKAFVADLTDDKIDLMENLDEKLMDLVSLIFVLSAVDPRQMGKFVENISRVLKPGGLVLFRDYAIYDKAMLRFSQNSKLCDQLYVRQDGTRAYFFSSEQLGQLFESASFEIDTIEYVERETINNASKEKFSRRFLQAKFRKR